MKITTIFSLAPLAQLASTACVPRSNVKNVVSDAADYVETISIKVGDLLASAVPLDAFGGFDTITLQEVQDQPELLTTTTVTDGVSSPSSNNDDDPDTEPATKLVTLPDTSTSTNSTPLSATCTTPQTRIEWRNYTASDRQAFVDAIYCLMTKPSAGDVYAPSTSRYEDFVQTHQSLVGSVHGSGLFLFWHRYFLTAFETALRGECGFDRPMPWWDETLDTGKFAQAPLFTPEYFGSLPGPTNGAGTCVTDGRFANITAHIGPGMNYVERCVSRAVNETRTAQSSAFYMSYCAQFDDYATFARCAESGPHAWAHNGIGADMANVASSPSDAIFFMHHLCIDHQLASWQEANATRKQAVSNSCADTSNPCVTPLTVDTALNMNGLIENLNVEDVLDTRGDALCYSYDYYY